MCQLWLWGQVPWRSPRTRTVDTRVSRRLDASSVACAQLRCVCPLHLECGATRWMCMSQEECDDLIMMSLVCCSHLAAIPHTTFARRELARSGSGGVRFVVCGLATPSISRQCTTGTHARAPTSPKGQLVRRHGEAQPTMFGLYGCTATSRTQSCHGEHAVGRWWGAGAAHDKRGATCAVCDTRCDMPAC